MSKLEIAIQKSGRLNEESILLLKKCVIKVDNGKDQLAVCDIQLNCDQDTLLIKAIPNGPTCHTGSFSCFRKEEPKGILYELEQTIHKKNDTDDSNYYTNKLFKRGINKVIQKVGEEAEEVVI